MYPEKIRCTCFWIYLWKNYQISWENIIDIKVINLQTPTTKYPCFQYSIAYCSHLSGKTLCCENPFDVLTIIGDGCCQQSGAYQLVFHWSRYKDEWPVLSRCLVSSTASASHLWPAWRLYFPIGQRSSPQGVWDHAAVNLWNNTRLHRSSSVASQQSWPEPSRLPDVGEASQPEAWRWPPEVTPDQRVGKFPPDVHRWNDQAVESSSLHLSTQRAFWTQTLVMFYICTDVHFESYVCTIAYSGLYCFGVISLNPL